MIVTLLVIIKYDPYRPSTLTPTPINIYQFFTGFLILGNCKGCASLMIGSVQLPVVLLSGNWTFEHLSESGLRFISYLVSLIMYL
jgi:hypothetical protein